MSKAKDVAAVTSFAKEYDARVSSGDSSAIANSFTPDAVAMPQDGSVLTGREAIWSWYQKVLAESNVKQVASVDEIEVTGDSALVRTTLTASFTPKGGGKPTDVRCRAMAIEKRQADGSWKMSRVMWTMDKPLPAPGK